MMHAEPFLSALYTRDNDIKLLVKNKDALELKVLALEREKEAQRVRLTKEIQQLRTMNSKLAADVNKLVGSNQGLGTALELMTLAASHDPKHIKTPRLDELERNSLDGRDQAMKRAAQEQLQQQQQRAPPSSSAGQ